MNDILNLSVTELSEKIKSKELSSKEATEAYLAKIKESDGEIGAYLTVTDESALKKAEEVDKKIAAGGNRILPSAAFFRVIENSS